MDVLCEPTAFLTLNKRLFNRNDWVRHICHCFTNHYIVRVPHKSQVLIYAQDNERNDFFSSNCQTSYCELADLLLERDSAQLDIYSIASDSGLYTHHAPAALINVPLIHIWCCILRYFMIKPILYYACFHLKNAGLYLQFDDLLRGNPVIHMPCRSYALWFLRHALPSIRV